MEWLFRTWLPIALAVTGMSVLVYVAVQQNYRAALNDPQIRMAHDAADRLDSGEKLSVVIPARHVDIDKSLATWLAVYDMEGKPIATSGTLFSATPTPPVGMLTVVHADASYNGENRVAWQPYNGVSQALVVVAAKDKIIVSGRNAREVEDRIWALGTTVFLFWLFTVGLALIAARFGAKARDSFL